MKNLKKLAAIVTEQIDTMLESAEKQIKANYRDEDHNKVLEAFGNLMFEEGVGTIFFTATDMEKAVGATNMDSKTRFNNDRNFPKTRKTPSWIENAKSSDPDEMYERNGVKELKAEIVREVMKRLASE